MDLLDVQPSRTSLTQNFDDIGRFEEPEGRGKLTLQVASDEEYRCGKDYDTYPQQIFHQRRPRLIDRGGKLATSRDDALRCSSDSRVPFQRLSKIFVRRILGGTVMGLVERGKLHRCAL